MPSMRAMMTAGKSADRDNTCVYNCSYLPVDDLKSFDEACLFSLWNWRWILRRIQIYQPLARSAREAI